jgi:hypothetical protein
MKSFQGGNNMKALALLPLSMFQTTIGLIASHEILYSYDILINVLVLDFVC